MNNNLINLSNEKLLSLYYAKNWLNVAGAVIICVGGIMALPEEITVSEVIGRVACILDGL